MMDADADADADAEKDRKIYLSILNLSKSLIWLKALDIQKGT